MLLEAAAVCLVGFVCSRHPRLRATWVTAAAALLAAHVGEEEAGAAEAARALVDDEGQRRQWWWALALQKRAPLLSGGDGSYRGRRRFGFAGGWGQNPSRQMDMSAAGEFYSHFRFAKEDIPRLCRALRFPAKFRTRSKCVCEGGEALLVYLKRMAYPNRWVDLCFFFCASQGWLSEVCDEVNEHLYQFSHHLANEYDHDRLAPLVETFAAAVHAKGAPLANIFALIDGTFRQFCRPGLDGYNGLGLLDQRAQYSGHKKCHGNNHQGVVTPDGIIVEMHGPFEGRTNDKRMLAESGMMDRLERDFPDYCVFGDRGYDAGHPSLQIPFTGAHITQDEANYNLKMLKIRQPVEWAFGKVVNLFAFVDFKKNNKLHKQPVGIFYLNAVLLANCHSCLYGNQTARYFNIPTPDLEDYLFNA